MFDGNDEELKQTKMNQLAVFIHLVASALCLDDFKSFNANYRLTEKMQKRR